jgi:hypothetical protein
VSEEGREHGMAGTTGRVPVAYQTTRPIERTSWMYHLALNIVFCCLKRIPAAPVLVSIMLLFSFLNCCWLDKEGGEWNRRRGDKMFLSTG